MCKEKRAAHSLCTSCNRWLCSLCTEEHRHGKDTGDCFLSASLKGCTGTEDALSNFVSSPVTYSVEKGAAADTVPCVCDSGYACVGERLCDFSVALGPLPQSAFHRIGRSLGNRVSQRLSFPRAFSVCGVMGYSCNRPCLFRVSVLFWVISFRKRP